MMKSSRLNDTGVADILALLCNAEEMIEQSQEDSSRSKPHVQAAKFKWRALGHTCLLPLSVLGGMPASHQGMQARLFLCGRYLITVMYTEKS